MKQLGLLACIGLAVAACSGCAPMNEQVEDRSAGLNGGFEHSQSGLPVNWLVYSPETIPTGSYELVFDQTDFKEGTQSLKFLVHEASTTGGWHSPGIAQELPATPGTSYVISFWIKSRGSDWVVQYGGVDAKTGRGETVRSSDVTADSWRRIERTHNLPQEYERIRFELSIRSPGTVWIDDVRIEPIVEELPSGE